MATTLKMLGTSADSMCISDDIGDAACAGAYWGFVECC